MFAKRPLDPAAPRPLGGIAWKKSSLVDVKQSAYEGRLLTDLEHRKHRRKGAGAGSFTSVNAARRVQRSTATFAWRRVGAVVAEALRAWLTVARRQFVACVGRDVGNSGQCLLETIT